MISLIWAMDKKWLIGKNNVLPWHYPEDLLYFKETTANQSVLMGRKTFESLISYYKNKPLPFGTVYVATRETQLKGATVVNDLQSFITNWGKDELFVLGGAEIYAQTLPYADCLYITWINAIHEGDTYFPSFDLYDWILKKSYINGPLNFTFYERKNEHA